MTGAEAVGIRRLAHFLLLLEGKTDLVELFPELGMIGWKGNETRKSTGSVFVAFLLDEPSRRFWEKDHARSENETPYELDGNRDLPRCVRVDVLGGVVDNGRDKEADGDRPLITGNDCPAVSLFVMVSDPGRLMT